MTFTELLLNIEARSSFVFKREKLVLWSKRCASKSLCPIQSDKRVQFCQFSPSLFIDFLFYVKYKCKPRGNNNLIHRDPICKGQIHVHKLFLCMTGPLQTTLQAALVTEISELVTLLATQLAGLLAAQHLAQQTAQHAALLASKHTAQLEVHLAAQ